MLNCIPSYQIKPNNDLCQNKGDVLFTAVMITGLVLLTLYALSTQGTLPFSETLTTRLKLAGAPLFSLGAFVLLARGCGSQ